MDEEALKILRILRDELTQIHQYIRQGDTNLAIWELGSLYKSVCFIYEKNAPEKEKKEE